MKAILFVVLLLAFGFNRSVQPQATSDEDFCASYKKSDAQLNKLYQRILVEYRNDKLFITKFRAAQRAWLAFSDAQIESHYPDPSPAVYGSINKMCRCEEMNELLKTRIKQLKQWTDGVQEGDVCAGSIKIKKSK